MKTLYVTDLDGTLLESDATLSPATARTIARLTSQGALITCATARTPATVQPLLSAARLSAPAIVMTGAALWTIDRPDPALVDASLIDSDTACTLRDIFAHSPVCPFVYTLSPRSEAPRVLTVYHSVAGLTPAEKAFVEPRSHLTLKHFAIGGEAPVDSHVIFCFAMGEQNHVKAVAQDIARHTDCSLSLYPDNYLPGIYLLEIFAHGVSKARAVVRLKQRVGADRLVVFGDNLNDLSMMAEADLSVASPIALPQVKEAADITLSPRRHADDPSPVAAFIAADYLAAIDV